MTASFVRQLGAESGVQLNPVQDRSELPSGSISDQVYAIAGRFERGRIDKAFKVNESNVRKKLGSTAAMRSSALNEALVHVVESTSQGAYEVVVSRLSTASAVVKWLVCKVNPGTPEDGGTPATPDTYTFEVAEEEPTNGFLFAIKHLECFNDGIKVGFHAENQRVGGLDVAVDKITVRIYDKDDAVLFEFFGSLNQDSRDDYGEPDWLPEVVDARTDAVQMVCTTSATIKPDSAAYGASESGAANWAKSGVLVCFTEGSTAYTTNDYVRARNQLQFTPFNFAYISSGGTRAPALLAQLAILAFNTSRQLRFDVPGDMTPEAAIAFIEQLNMSGQSEAHLLHAYWAPLRCSDPTGINGKALIGVATLNIAMACRRNAVLDAKGFPPKNYPVAGKDFPLPRYGITQIYTPTNQELSDLAKAKINPVIYSEYDGGGRYVYLDSLTCAPVDNSLKKLIAVSDMACHTDDAVTRYAKGVLQKPMKDAARSMDDMLRNYFDGAQAAGWIVPSNDPTMGGRAARWSVQPNEARPYDQLDVRYSVRYDGTARAIHVTQTFTK